MSDGKLKRVLWPAAAIVLGIGVVMTIQAVRRMDAISLRFEKKLRNLDRLRSLQRELDRYVSAQRAFERLPAKRPVAVERLLEDSLPGWKADDVRKFRRESVSGWVVRQEEIVFGEIPLSKLMEFVYKAEMQRPPWRLIRCDIKASSRAGTGRVVLLLEAMEKPVSVPGA